MSLWELNDIMKEVQSTLQYIDNRFNNTIADYDCDDEMRTLLDTTSNLLFHISNKIESYDEDRAASIADARVTEYKDRGAGL